MTEQTHEFQILTEKILDERKETESTSTHANKYSQINEITIKIKSNSENSDIAGALLRGLMRYHYTQMNRIRENLVGTDNQSSSPPKGLMIDLFLPPTDAEEALYHLTDRYNYWTAKHGELWARVIFMSQSTSVIARFWVAWTLKHLNVTRSWRKG